MSQQKYNLVFWWVFCSVILGPVVFAVLISIVSGPQELTLISFENTASNTTYYYQVNDNTNLLEVTLEQGVTFESWVKERQEIKSKLDIVVSLVVGLMSAFMLWFIEKIRDI